MPTAANISDRVRTGRISADSVTVSAIERAEASQDTINGFTLIDREESGRRAQEIDLAGADGRDPGPLAGVPIGLKDLIDQAGLPNTLGAAYAPITPARSATVVRRIEAAGGVIIGRTGLHEFAFGFTSENPFFGPVRNPWDPATSAGGSSGGSGAVVAAGIVPVAIGTDTGGSVRVPAALCGVFGFKPSHGSVSLTGVFPLAPSLDTVGPIARTVEDIRTTQRVLVGYDPDDPYSAPPTARPAPQRQRTKTIGVVRPWFRSGPTSEKVRVGLDEFEAAARAAGFTVVDVDDAVFDVPGSVMRAACPEILEVHRERLDSDPERYSAETLERLRGCEQADAALLHDAQRWGASARAAMAGLVDDGIDVFVAPTVGAMRKTIGDDDMDIDGRSVFHRAALASFTAPINRLGVPAMAAPVATETGLPVSVQIIGQLGYDAWVIDTAADLEDAGVLRSGTPPNTWAGSH